MLNTNFITKGKAYPELPREQTKAGFRVTMQTVKVFGYAHGYITLDQLNDPDLDYATITTAIYRAFDDGVLSINATKQDGVDNLTPVRVSTGLSGKLDGVFAITTISLVNQFCLARMLNEDLVCSKCYVPESLRIDGILAFAQNMYVLTHFDFELQPELITQLNAAWAKKQLQKKLEDFRRRGKIDISDDEIKHLVEDLKPLCRFESMGDLACSLQAKKLYLDGCSKRRF